MPLNWVTHTEAFSHRKLQLGNRTKCHIRITSMGSAFHKIWNKCSVFFPPIVPRSSNFQKLDLVQDGWYVDPSSPQTTAVWFCMFVSEREDVKRTEKSMCFCVNSGNGGCVVPSACALAVPDSHGQSRGAIMNSQEGLFRRALPNDTLCWARIQRNYSRLSLSAGDSSVKHQSQKSLRI